MIKKDFTQGVTIGFFLINRYFGVETYGQLAIVMSTAGIFSAREMINKNAKFV